MRRPDMKRTVLQNKVRVVLFWFTITLILAVTVIAVVTILHMFSGSEAAAPPPAIAPAEVALCPGQQQSFTTDAAEASELMWAADGGTISSDGTFIAGSRPGDYVVTVSREGAEETGEATVHIDACTPTPTVTPASTTEPTTTATMTMAGSPSEDTRGDVLTYEGNTPAASVPSGVDIRLASVAPDGAIPVQPGDGTPQELLDWASEGEVVLWMTLYEPVPEVPEVYTYWLFALDTDGNVDTGRTPGTARINPDLGDEAALGVYFDPASGTFVPDLSIWDPDGQAWITIDGGARYYIDDTRTLIGLAAPYETLARSVADSGGVTIVPDAIRGRAGVLSYAGDEPVVDFYPDRPQ